MTLSLYFSCVVWHNITKLKELGEGIRNYEHYSDPYKVYYASKSIAWDYTQERPYKGDTITAGRRMYLHLYYNPEKAVEDDQQRTAYYVRLGNELISGKRRPEHEKDPIEALHLYRTQDVVEKAFGNLKERLNCRRTLVSFDTSLDGKRFVTFVSLIYLSYIKEQMQKHDLFQSTRCRVSWTSSMLLNASQNPGKRQCREKS